MAEKFAKLPVDLMARKDLSATAKLVYAAIRDHLGKNSYAYPGYGCTAREIGMSIPAVRRAVRQLQSAGAMAVEYHSGPRGANRYRFPTGNGLSPVTDDELLPVDECHRVQHVPSTHNKLLTEPVTTCSPNQTNEPDSRTRPSIHLVDDARMTLFKDQDQDGDNKRREVNQRKPREPDPIWDTLAELFNVQNSTKNDRSRLGRIVTELRAKNATPEEVRSVYQRCKTEWEGRAFSPEALTKWFDQFRGQPNVSGSPARIHDGSGRYGRVATQINASLP